MANPAQRRAVDALVCEALDHLDGGRLAAAEQCISAASVHAADAAQVRFARAQLYAAQGREGLAAKELAAACAKDPCHADAHYAMGCLHEAAGDHHATVSCFLTVLRLDAAADRRDNIGTLADRARIEHIATRVLDGLPDRFSRPLASIPIQLLARPSEDLVREGFDPRALGLFEGAQAGDAIGFEGVRTTPSRIVLFYGNLLATSDDASLADEVEVTLLHEIGHFFGLDEDGVAALGLA